MQSRVLAFQCLAKVPELKDTVACAQCMARWVHDEAAASDARVSFQSLPPTTAAGDRAVAVDGAGQSDGSARLLGMAALARLAKLPPAKEAALEAEVLGMGAVHAKELAVEDWTSLAAWSNLLPFERRRMLSTLQF